MPKKKMLQKLQLQETCSQVAKIAIDSESINSADGESDIPELEKNSDPYIVFSDNEKTNARTPDDMSQTEFDELCKDFLLSELEDAGFTIEDRFNSYRSLRNRVGSSWNSKRSTTAVFAGGTLRGTSDYRGAGVDRFDSVCMESCDNPRRDGKPNWWYGSVQLFVQIQSFNGVLISWFVEEPKTKTAVYSNLTPLKWWLNSAGKHRYTIVSLGAIEERVHVVPDFSFKQRSQGAAKQDERFLLNQHYILL
jgi:hypothetical protein